MGRCRLAVVHKSYWEAYRDLKKLVEFRSPRQTIPFFPGMIMLLFLNACERRKGGTELLMAGVSGIYVLSCSEAYAHFPVEARACDLESLCKRWRGNNTVQCLVLDKNSLRVASEVRNLAAGNLGLLRQINDRAGTARFCCSVDLGKTAMVRLSTGKLVHCTYTESWPESTYTERAPSRTGAGGGEESSAGRRRRRSAAAGEEAPTKVSRCPLSSALFHVSTGAHAPALEDRDTACLATVTVTMELFVEVLKLAASMPVSTEVERDLAMSFGAMRSAQNSRPILTSHRDVNAIRAERNPNHQKAKTDEIFRTKLIEDIVQYVTISLQSAELVCSLSDRHRKAAAFRDDLVQWIQTRFLPVVRERLPDCMLSPLLTAAKISLCNGDGQLQRIPASLGAAAAAPGTGGAASMLTAARHQRSVPAARRLAFDEYQHLHDRCERCATDCKSVRSRFMCSCGAICCKACYGLKGTDANDVDGYQCDACREEHKGGVVVFPRRTSTAASHAGGSCSRPPRLKSSRGAQSATAGSASGVRPWH